MIKHAGKFTTGLQMVGAVCDFCEAFVCHGKKCLTTHCCSCPLRDADCLECKRGVWEHGGRVYKCCFCGNFLCEDDQFEHQASCQQLDSENYKCGSCNKIGQFTCLRCKICFCDDHVKRKGVKYEKTQSEWPCPKCGFNTVETKDYSVSARKHAFGRQQANPDDYEGFSGYGYDASATDYGNADYGSDDEEDDDEDYEDSEEDSDEQEEGTDESEGEKAKK